MGPFDGLGFSNLAGMPIIETLAMVDRVEDWSGVRSPGRARRRRLLGYPQKIKVFDKPKTEAVQMGGRLYMHPMFAAELRRQLAATPPPNSGER